MKELFINKVLAGVLIAGIICIIISYLSSSIYKPGEQFERKYVSSQTNNIASSASQESSPIVPDIKDLMIKASAEVGSNLVKKCMSCHSFEKSGKNGIGPNLYGVYGAKKGHREDYKYSDAMLAKGGTWEDEDIFTFLIKPSKFVPGTKMVYPGLGDKYQDIANVIAYLKTLKD